MSIQILDKLTAEQIAAGEVIENPASVVKELVENSLDAGAGKIEVVIEGGGKKRLAVTDDGTGINPGEVPLAFKRFATSKLATLDDLQHLVSLGFRGEALPSIAAVARVNLTTRRNNDLEGVSIALAGGEILSHTEAGCPQGTKVEVSDLFYNTPGRLKFLRADAVEASRVSSLITSMALVHPNVTFVLRSESKILFSSSGDGVLLHVIAAIYGNDCALAMLDIHKRDLANDCSISGYISAPHYSRSSRRWITVMVNRRLIKDAAIINALARGYGSLIPRQRHPLAVLHLQVPPGMLDVNVHPAKTEVRFQHPEIIKNLVYRSVKTVVQGEHIMPLSQLASQSEVNEELAESYVDDIRTMSRFSNCQEYMDEDHYFPESNSGKQIAMGTIVQESDSISAEQFDYRLIGQHLQSYLVVQKKDDLLLIDQHAAHERVIYHQLTESDKIANRSTQLTIPLPLEIPCAWREQLRTVLPLLAEIGFDLEIFGDTTYLIRSVPFLIRDNLTSDFLYDIIEDLFSGEREPGSDMRQQIRKTIACHGSIKAKQALTRDEMEKLLREWQKIPQAQYCPHGRPAIISFHRDQLEKWFKRKGG